MYLSCPTFPSQIAGETAADWSGMPTCWQILGFLPEVRLRGQYEVSATTTHFEATCKMDLDEDGELAIYRASDLKTAAKDPSGGI